jgi:hypothetical protein
MSQDIVQALRKKIPTAHRERLLWEASREYMRGNISASELKEIEDSTSPHSRSASPLSDEKHTGQNHS